MFIDTRELPDNAELNCDICIIGAGPAGITLADGLAKSGLQICLTEAGGLSHQSEHASRGVSEQLGHPITIHPRTKYFGGMSNIWGGVRGRHVRLLPLDPIDFEERSWVPNSGWPISYQELKPFYKQACSLLDDIPFLGFDTGQHDHDLLAAFDDDVMRSTMIHLASPVRFGQRFRRSLDQANNVRVLISSNAIEIEESHSEHRISSIRAVAGNGRRHRLSARTFVLACGGLETARLMLASKRKHDCGVGNQNDLVGRYYMQHPKGSHGLLALRRHSRLTGYVRGTRFNDRLMQACVTMTEQRQRHEGLLNHRIALAPLMQLSESHASRLYHQLRACCWEGFHDSALRRRVFESSIEMPKVTASTCKNILLSLSYGTQHYRVINHMEQAPDPASRIELSRDKDRFGVPELRTNWRINTEDKHSLCRLHELLDNNLKRYGIGKLYTSLNSEANAWPISSSSSHDLGTVRMNDSPRYGVTDGDGRVHGVDNLYVIGGALFPTVGNANPTLTIIALALRMIVCLTARTRITPMVLSTCSTSA